MNFKSLTTTFISCLLAAECFAWGQIGHDATCQIAENHLSRKAKKKIAKALDRQSIVYWSNWLDNASHQPEYAYAKTWHYKNIDEGQTFDEVPTPESGDIISALTDLYNKLKSHTLSKEEEALSLKMFVHLMGDLHQPMHMGHLSDIGGNTWKVMFFKEETSLHHVWDEELVESGHRWTYDEWAYQLDRKSKKEIAEIVKGDFTSWAKETFAYTQQVYNTAPRGAKLSYDYIATWTPIVEERFIYGGLRLAYLLNEIYK